MNMNLFKKGDKPLECNCSFVEVEPVKSECHGEKLSVKVLGAGCKKCHELYENTKSAAMKSTREVSVEYITDMQIVMNYGVMSMPAVVINEKVVSMGRVLSADEVLKLIEGYKA